jgi:hypothetical protein
VTESAGVVIEVFTRFSGMFDAMIYPVWVKEASEYSHKFGHQLL